MASAVSGSPVSSADPSDFQYVTTVSGAVRCVIGSDHVSCERSSAEGFPDAPPANGGGNMNIARVDADGSFEWGLANLGSPDDPPVTLTYDQTFHFNGWTVEPTFNGTRFTNDATNHGMSVNIDGADPF
jgi:hypothetical protein